MIGYTKRLEFEIKKCIDTPIKMFKILKASQSKIDIYGKKFLNEDLKQEDLNKLYKYLMSLTGNPYSLVEYHIISMNVNEFIHAV
jgi:hypothetical protein